MRREGRVEGRESSDGLLPWGEIMGVRYSCEQAREGGRGFDLDAKRGRVEIVCEM